MPRFITPMIALLGLASGPLAGQARLSLGFAGTLGSNWQIEALEAGFVSHLPFGPVRDATVAVRAGWFGDQAAIIGGTRGFVGALAVGVRSAPLGLAQVGQDPTPTRIAADVSLEVAGYIAANSPRPYQRRWVSVALLPGLRVGKEDHTQFLLVAGPAWFAGAAQRLRAFLGVRVEIPLARGAGGA